MTRQQVLAISMLVLGCLLLSPWRPWPAELSENSVGSWLRIEPQLIEQRLGVLGRIQAVRQVTVAAPFAGLLQALPIAPGQQVAAGDIIAVLDTAELDPQVRQAEAQLLQSQRALRQLQAWASGSEMAQAKRAQAMASSSLELAQVALKQTQRLFDRGIVARQEVEALQQQMVMLQQDLLDARQHLRQTRERGQGVDLRLASIELDAAQARQRELAALRKPARGTRTVQWAAGASAKRGPPTCAASRPVGQSRHAAVCAGRSEPVTGARRTGAKRSA